MKRQNFTHLEDPGKPRESLHKSQTNIKKFTETSREPKEFTKSSYSNPDRKMSSWWFQPLWNIMKNFSRNGNLPQVRVNIYFKTMKPPARCWKKRSFPNMLRKISPSIANHWLFWCNGVAEEFQSIHTDLDEHLQGLVMTIDAACSLKKTSLRKDTKIIPSWPSLYLTCFTRKWGATWRFLEIPNFLEKKK